VSSHAFLWGPSSQWPLKSAGEEARAKEREEARAKERGILVMGWMRRKGQRGMVMRWMRRGRRQRRARQ
jgi:hypothetical protein